MTNADNAYLLPERVRPVADATGLVTPFWDGLRAEKVVLQRCEKCSRYQWGPEYVCYRCGTDELAWAEVPTGGDGAVRGVVYSWERVWHPVDPSLVPAMPYVVLLVELPDADRVHMVSNLVDPPEGPIEIGAELTPVFEHHESHTLLLWRLGNG